jgi:hypothetical protein
MAFLTPHEDAINIALIDALHAFSNETGKAEADHNSDKERGYQDLPTLSISAPPDSPQTREAVDLYIPPPQIINGTAGEGDLSLDLRYMGHSHFSLIDTRSTSEINSKKKRPAYRYATLIAMAILQANDRCLPLAQIYQWISDQFPYYSLTESGWQNSVRHSLSVKEYFIKIERPSHDPGKGHYWGIKPGQEHQFTQESDVDRSAKAIGSLRRRRDWIQCPSAKVKQLVTTSTTHSLRGLSSNDKTIEEDPQQVEEAPRLTVETSGSIFEREVPHSLVIPSPLAPSPFSRPRQEIETSSLPWQARMDHVDRNSRADTNQSHNICNSTPSDDTPVTHVYLPHLMRNMGPKRQRFEAHRAESEITRIRRSRTNRLRSTSQG